MIIYEYKCRACGATLTSTVHGLDQPHSMLTNRTVGACPVGECRGTLKRVYSFTATRPMEEHFNATVGMPIRSNKQFDDELKRKSDEMSARIGMEHRYRRIDPEQVRATQEGMEPTYRAEVATGKRETKLIL